MRKHTASACRYDHLPCQLTNGTVVSPDIYSFCCNGNIYPKVLNGRKNCCCKDSLPGGIPQVYNPEEHICCLGGKFPRRDSLGQEQGCCGTKPYPRVRGQLCCVPQPHENHANANLFTSLIGENDTCCGNEKYDSTTQVCCTDGMFKVRLYTKDNNKICCQKDYINKNTHDCIINKETNRLGKTLKFSRSCGDTKIDDRQDLCCNGQAHRNVSQVSSHSCCGDEIFNRNTHQCCGNTHTIAINMQCCGSHRDGEYLQISPICPVLQGRKHEVHILQMSNSDHFLTYNLL
ncbi:galaxin-like [Ylistrum balloti]|uniref:galaxin-like n=1 Tax=Ylistrum balloti TaxID=509963 RepID=UPI002905C0EF|nr:galaxin-like [Ylistrum balloti]